MSDTPRTDAEVERVMQQCRGEYHLEGGDFVDTEFARQLEREVNELRSRLWQAEFDADPRNYEPRT